ncbi:MAG: S9 family peptidase [Gemmatimonadales bacterium]|nr:S9 family peptidase [Gemmatimonadales bacterium]
MQRICFAVLATLLVTNSRVCGQQAATVPDGTVLTQEPYRLPHKTIDAWFSEVKRADSTFGPERQARARKAFGPGFDRLRGAGVRVTKIGYASGGYRVVGYLLTPRTERGKRYPALIYNRGGNRDFGQLGLRNLIELSDLAARGYIVVASQYRGNDGGEGREEFGGADVEDVLNLLPVLDARSDVDTSRIGMYGWSRGGMMTYLALARTDRIRAAVIGAGVSDHFDTIRHRPDMESGVFAELIPDYLATKDSALRARSAVYWADRLHKRTPILMLHGTGDWRVDASQALRMATRLYETRHPFRLVLFEGGDHGLTEYWGDVDSLILQWLDTYVRDRKPWPSLDPHGR